MNINTIIEKKEPSSVEKRYLIEQYIKEKKNVTISVAKSSYDIILKNY